MLFHRSSATPVEMLPGVVRRTLTEGERMMLIEVTLQQGAVVPLHTHPHEQIGYLASGRLLWELATSVVSSPPAIPGWCRPTSPTR